MLLDSEPRIPYGQSVESVNDLTIPRPSSNTARTILGRRLRQTVRELLQIPSGRFRAQIFDDFADTRALLIRLAQTEKSGLVYSILRRPTHSTLITCLHSELWGAGDVAKLDEWLLELTALILLELARYRELPVGGVRLREHPKRFLSIDGNFQIEIDASWQVGFRPGQLILQRSAKEEKVELDSLAGLKGDLFDGVAVRHPYHSIIPEVVLATVDNNPLSEHEAHPDKHGNQVDLGGCSVADWVAGLREAFALIDEQVPDLAREFRLTMQAIVPCSFYEEKHLSASYSEATGLAYLSLHPDRLTMVEALIHEFSHNKINALLQNDSLLVNAFEPLFSSPIRPDPRPLHGILLAVHAFVPVAYFYEKMKGAKHPLSQAPGFERRFQEIVARNHDGIATLAENAEFTSLGRSVFAELADWDRHFERLRDDLSPGAK